MFVLALDSNVQVPLPDKKIVKHKIGDVTYAYLITRAYRNEAGKPTNDRVSIGKIDNKTGMLIPNRNYYEIYLKTEAPEVKSIKSFGVTFIVDKILKQLGLDRLLKRSFPELWDKIVALAEYMMCEGNIMSYYEDWNDETYSFEDTKLNSQQISRVFQNIDYKRRMDFFKTWIHAREQKEYVAYDVTSISSYSKGIDNLEWGYNRDKEDLPQINLGMYYGEESQLPLYYNVYPGSIPDKTHLAYMLRDNGLIGYKQTKFVMDKGFFSADNIKLLTEAGCRFVMSIPNHLVFSRKMIDKYRNEIVGHSEYYIGNGMPYGKGVIVEEFGIRAKVHIYYSSEKAAAEERLLFERITEYERVLLEMSEAPSKDLKYDRYFKINVDHSGGFGFIRDNEKINKEISRLGFFLIMETDFNSTSEDILGIYRRRDIVEKSFDEMKNELDMNRLLCHTDATVEGKMFVAFFALILRSYLQNRLKEYQTATNQPFAAVIKELGKLKYVCTSDGRKLLAPVTKKQRDIIQACGFTSEDIPNWLAAIHGYGRMV